MSKKNVEVKSEVKSEVKTEKNVTEQRQKRPDVFLMQSAHANQKLILTRTDAIAAVLIEAFQKNELLKTSEIVERARKLLGADHVAYEKLDRTINAHLYTLQGANGRSGRESVIEKVEGRWRLNAYGAKLLALKANKKAR